MPTKLTRQNLSENATISLHAEYDVERASFPDDPESERWIAAQLEAGNTWAWCVVTVTATLDDDSETRGLAVLGGCSYESRADFERDNLAQMTEEALDDLWAQLESRTPAGRARSMASSSRQAITTSYRPVGPKIIARCESKRITVQWEDSLDVAGNHAAAALQLMDQLGWSERNELAMGGTRDGFVFVQVPKVNR